MGGKTFQPSDLPGLIGWWRRFTVAIRREGKGEVRPNAEKVDGRTFLFRRGWEITVDDRAAYAGEVAWIPDDAAYPDDGPTWIASGDLREPSHVKH